MPRAVIRSRRSALRRAAAAAASLALFALHPAAAQAGSFTAFFRAVQTDDASEVRELLRRGFDPNATDARGNPALYVAIRDKAPQVVQTLLQQPGIKLDQRNAAGESPLMMACLRGDTELARTLIQAGANVNVSGWTPLSYAATNGHDAIVQLLLDHGAKVDAQAPNGTTALMMAAYFGHASTVRLLLQAGADVTRRNAMGFDALQLAMRQGHDDVAALLGASIRRQSRQPGHW